MRREFKIGIFAVLVLTGSFFLLNYLRGKDLLNREIQVVSQYEDLQGLVPSAPVFIKGFKAGKVTEVEYVSEQRLFNVTCSVSKDFQIPEDSQMAIYSIDVMGTKGVRIILGSADVPVADGDTLASVVEPGLMDALAEGIGPLLDKVSNTLDSLNVTVSGVNDLLSQSNISSVSNTLKNLEVTMANVRQLSRTVNGKSQEINDLVENLSSFSSGLEVLVSRADTTLTGINNVVATVNGADIAGVVTSFRKLLDNVNDPDGSVGKLFSNGSVYDSVDSLLVDLNVIVDKIKENPKKYLKISVL